MNSTTRFFLENPDAIKDACKDVRRWGKKSWTEAVNATAFEARENLVNRIKKEFYIRNSFLTSGKALAVTKAPFGHTDSLRDIQATVGFTEAASFMRRQDEGGSHKALAGKQLLIYTDAAREGGPKAGRVKRPYGYTVNARKMIIPLITKGANHKQRQVIRAAVAYKSGMLMYFNRNLFRITNFSHRDGRVVFRKEMIINRQYKETFTPAKNFFLPECEKAALNMQGLFNQFMDKNFNNH